MDGNRFDQLARTAAQTRSRRGLVRLAVGGALGLGLARSSADVAARHHGGGGGCTPQCGNAECGDDGCGGSCGSCAFNQVCQAGACVAAPDACPVAFACSDPFGGPAPVCGKVAGPAGGACGCYKSAEGNNVCLNDTDSQGNSIDANTLQPCQTSQECRDTVGFHFFCKEVTPSPSGKVCGATDRRCWPECDNPSGGAGVDQCPGPVGICDADPTPCGASATGETCGCERSVEGTNFCANGGDACPVVKECTSTAGDEATSCRNLVGFHFFCQEAKASVNFPGQFCGCGFGTPTGRVCVAECDNPTVVQATRARRPAKADRRVTRRRRARH